MPLFLDPGWSFWLFHLSNEQQTKWSKKWINARLPCMSSKHGCLFGFWFQFMDCIQAKNSWRQIQNGRGMTSGIPKNVLNISRLNFQRIHQCPSLTNTPLLCTKIDYGWFVSLLWWLMIAWRAFLILHGCADWMNQWFLSIISSAQIRCVSSANHTLLSMNTTQLFASSWRLFCNSSLLRT